MATNEGSAKGREPAGSNYDAAPRTERPQRLPEHQCEALGHGVKTVYKKQALHVVAAPSVLGARSTYLFGPAGFP